MSRADAPFARLQILGYLALCLIWGSTWLAIRIVVKEIPPLEAAALRFLIADVLLLGSLLFRRAKLPQGKSEWNAILLLSLTVMALPYGLLFWAEQYVTSSMTALLFSAMPLVVALITPLMLHRSVPRTAVFSMLMALGGIAILFNGLDANSRTLLGGFAVLAAVCISSWAVVYAKKALQNMDPVVATGLQCLFGCIALFWKLGFGSAQNRHLVADIDHGPYFSCGIRIGHCFCSLLLAIKKYAALSARKREPGCPDHRSGRRRSA